MAFGPFILGSKANMLGTSEVQVLAYHVVLMAFVAKSPCPCRQGHIRSPREPPKLPNRDSKGPGTLL